jgi:hypothetical protein
MTNLKMTKDYLDKLNEQSNQPFNKKLFRTAMEISKFPEGFSVCQSLK